MITELDLQEEIKKVLEDDVFANLSLFKAGEMQIHIQDIPLSTEYEKPAEYEDDGSEADEDDKYFPCCIVKLRGAEEKSPSEPQILTVEIIVVIKDWSRDMSGYKTLLVCLQRIRDCFLRHAGIKGKFRLLYPVKIVINEEAAIPYFIGSVTTNWATEVMAYNDPLNFL